MKKLFSILFLTFIFSASLLAQEGMWMLNQIEQLELNKRGLQISPKDIYNPSAPSLYNAIVQVGGGTGSFVSPEGLLVTNHHVAFTGLQRASSAQNDYLKNGFLAANRNEEIPAQGYVARLLVDMKDITAELNAAAASGGTPLEQEQLRKLKAAEFQKAAGKEDEDLQAQIAEMYNGKQYFLMTYRLYKDVRLVYAPPMSVGNYGGETDNWMWPRHTGDFTFMRVYASKDGKGKAYSTDNIPYKPKVWLKVAKDDLNDGDFTFILGFPGFTTRYRSSNSVDWNLNRNYPASIKTFKEIIELAEDLTKNDREGRIKISDLTKGLANAMKNYEGKVEAMKRTNYLGKKYDFEKEFTAWVNSDKNRIAKYGTILSREKAEYTKLEKNYKKDNFISNFQAFGGTPLSVAVNLYYVLYERSKPENAQRPDLTEEAVNEYLEGLQYSLANYYEPVDRALFLRMIAEYNALPEDQKIASLTKFFAENNPDKLASAWFAATKLTSSDEVKNLYKMTFDKLQKSEDAFIRIAGAIFDAAKEAEERNNVFGANVTAIREEYMDALFTWKGTKLYPDANSTLRFTSGYVKGYNPRDAVSYSPFTTLAGVIEKNTGAEPFDAPAELVSLYEKKDFGEWVDKSLNTVPVAFTHTCDITGGNSGSPVMNGKGELIGLAFDGNYEALISDWQYDAALQRTISVDIRYVLFITEKLGKAGFLLKEMGIK